MTLFSEVQALVNSITLPPSFTLEVVPQAAPTIGNYGEIMMSCKKLEGAPQLTLAPKIDGVVVLS